MKKNLFDELKVKFEKTLYLAVDADGEKKGIAAATSRELATELERILDLDAKSAAMVARAMHGGAQRIQLPACSVEVFGSIGVTFHAQDEPQVTRRVRKQRRTQGARVDAPVITTTSERLNPGDVAAPASGFLEWQDLEPEVPVDRPE